MVEYRKFSICYDEVLGKKFFENLKIKFFEISKKYKIENFKNILDLGCGTGLFLKNFYGKNIKLIGIDQSFSMLKEGKKNKDFFAICSTIPPIPLKKKFSLIVSFYDTLNHILNYDKLKELFKEVYSYLKDDGFFLFDTNNLNAFKYIMGDEKPFVYEGEKGFIEIKTEYFKNLKISKAEIIGRWFEIGIREEVYERYWADKEIRTCLKEVGFNFIKKEKWILKEVHRHKPVKDFWIIKKI